MTVVAMAVTKVLQLAVPWVAMMVDMLVCLMGEPKVGHLGEQMADQMVVQTAPRKAVWKVHY